MRLKQNEQQFFVLKKPSVDSRQDRIAGTEALKADDTRRAEAPRCPACGKGIGMLQWLPPYRVELETWGREFGDFAFLGGGDDLLVSERFREIYQSSGLTGLSGFEPVTIVKVIRHRKLRGNPPQYLKARVARSQAAIDYAASGYEFEGELPPRCPVCNEFQGVIVLRWHRTILQPGTWSGEDIFIAGGEPNFMTTERFKVVCETNNAQNAHFIPAETYGHDFNPSESKILLKQLTIFEDEQYSRSDRREAYRTLLFAVDDDWSRSSLLDRHFDPETDVDPAVIEAVKQRLSEEGLYP